MASPIVLRGGCACSKIRYTSTVLPDRILHCCCVQCRKSAGAPYQSFTGLPASAVTWESAKPKHFKYTTFATRGFCGDCGSSLTFQLDNEPDRVMVCVGSIDDWEVKGALPKPEAYIFCKEKGTWYDLPNDALEKFEEMPPGVEPRKTAENRA